MPHFWLNPPKIIGVKFSLLKFLSPSKKSVHSVNSFMRYRQFKSRITRLTLPFFLSFFFMAIQKLVNTLNFHESVSTRKKSGYLINLFWRLTQIKIAQSDWLRGFLHISQEPVFSQIWNLHRNTANDIVGLPLFFLSEMLGVLGEFRKKLIFFLEKSKPKGRNQCKKCRRF